MSYQCGALSDEHIRICLFGHLYDIELNMRCNCSRDTRPGNFLLDSGIFFGGCSRFLPKICVVFTITMNYCLTSGWFSISLTANLRLICFPISTMIKSFFEVTTEGTSYLPKTYTYNHFVKCVYFKTIKLILNYLLSKSSEVIQDR